LGSAAGTVVNGNRVVANGSVFVALFSCVEALTHFFKYEKRTCRRLHKGDVVTYGVSKTTYLVEWIGEDDDDLDDEDEGYARLSQLPAPSNAKIDAAAEKIAHLESESARIRDKADKQEGGLTAGQEKQLAANEGKMRALEDQIDKERTRISQAHAERHAVEASAEAVLDADGDGDDAFFDLTAAPTKRARTQGNDKAESYESLLAKVAQLQKRLDDLRDASNAVRAKSSAGEDEEDELAAFMAENDAQVRAVELARLEDETKTVAEQHARAVKLLEIARPALATTAAARLANAPAPRAAPAAVTMLASSMTVVSSALKRHRPPNATAPVSASLSGSARKPDAELGNDDAPWVPPANQRGDGKSRLNLKFNY